MKPIYIELTPAVGTEECIKINFLEVDDVIAAHGNEVEFAGNVTHHENRELPYAIIVMGGKRMPVIQSSAEVIKKLRDELRRL